MFYQNKNYQKKKKKIISNKQLFQFFFYRTRNYSFIISLQISSKLLCLSSNSLQIFIVTFDIPAINYLQLKHL